MNRCSPNVTRQCVFGALMFSLAVIGAAPAAFADSSIGLGSGVSLATQPLTDNANGGEWTYTVRPGDTLVSLTQELLEPRRRAADLLRHNQLADRAELYPGQIIRIPVQWLRQQPEPAIVTGVTGHALYRSPSSPQYQPLRNGTRLNVGDELRTDQGHVTLELADKTTLRVGPGSTLVLNRLTRFGRTGMADTRLRLERGQVDTRVTPFVDKGSRFEIETPSAVAAVRGTVFRLQEAQDQTRLEVTEGEVLFRHRQQTRDVLAGQGIVASTLGLGEIKTLPQPPQLLETPEQIDKLPAQFRWAHAQTHFRSDVMVVNAVTGELVLQQQGLLTELELGALNNGDYRIELASLDDAGWRSATQSHAFTVGLNARPARPVAPTSGGTVEDERPEFIWQTSTAHERGRIEIALDDQFGNVIARSPWQQEGRTRPGSALAPGHYFWRVVTQAGGTSEATTPAIPLTVRGVLPPVRILTVNQTRQQVRLFWQNVPQIEQYALQLSDDPEFSRILREEKIKATTAALKVDSGKRYFVRLKGIVDEPLISRWGPGHEILVD